MAERFHTPTGAGGFTLVEVTIILLVLVILSTIMLPQLGNFNRLARKVKVIEDLGALCASMKKFLDEVMLPGPFGTPGGGSAAATLPIGILVGTVGTPPANPPAAVDCSGFDSGTGGWDTDISLTSDFTCTPDIPIGTPAATTFRTDFIENHLQINDPFGDGFATDADKYKNQVDLDTVGAFFGWRGPYFDTITSDPWGGRYAINTFALHRGTGGNFSSPVICYSAGPDNDADTNFNMPHPNGYVVGGDDFAVVLSAMGPF